MRLWLYLWCRGAIGVAVGAVIGFLLALAFHVGVL